MLAFIIPFLAASALTFKLAPTGVTPGSYTNPVITLDAKGRATSASNGRPLSYVNAMDYGPSGTGSTSDDTSELQAAIDATPEGGALYIPAGLYLISSTLTATKGITIFGDGAQSVLYLAPWFPTNSDVLKFSATSQKTGVQLENFAIYQHPGYANEKVGRNALLFDCSGSSGWSNVIVRSMYIEARNGAAIKVDNSDGDSISVNGLAINDNILFGGINLQNVGSDIRIQGNSIAYSSSGNTNSYTGITLSQLSTSSDAQIDGNYITAFGGINISGYGIKIHRNAIHDCGVTNAFTTNRIYVASATSADIRGNTIDPMLSASTYYGINIASGVLSTRVGPNNFDATLWAGHTSQQILNNGTSSVIEVDGDIISTGSNTFVTGTTNTFNGDVVFTNGVTLGGARRTTWPSGGGTNASTVFVNNATQVDGPSFNTSTELVPSAAATNITYAIVANSVATNKINSTFYDWVMRPKGVYVDAGIAMRLDDSGEILVNMSGSSNAILGIADYGVGLVKIGTNATAVGDIIYRAANQWTNEPIGTTGYVLTSTNNKPTWMPAPAGTGGGGTNYTFTNGVTAAGTTVTANILGAGGVTLSTNGSGVVTITGTTVTNAPVSGLVQRLGAVEFDLITDGSSITTWSNFVANVTTNGVVGTPWMTNATDNSGNTGTFSAEYGMTARLNVPLYGVSSTNYWFAFDALTQLQPTNYNTFGSTRGQVITSQIGTTNLQVLLGTKPEVNYGLGGTASIHYFTNRFRLSIYSTATAGGGLQDGDKGDITVSNNGETWTIDSPSSSSDMFDQRHQWEEYHFNFAGNTTTLALETMAFTAISSGALGVSTATYGRNGVLDIKTATGVGLNTGGVISINNAGFIHTNVTQYELIANVTKTNGALARAGFFDTVGTGIGTDSFGFLVTNNTVVGTAVKNTSQTLTSTTYTIEEAKWYKWRMRATNDIVWFSLLTNNVVAWSDFITNGLPVGAGRNTQPTFGCWNGATAVTNGVTMFQFDWLGFRLTASPED